MTADKKLLGQVLLEDGRITPEELQRALARQERHAEVSRNQLLLHTRRQRRRRLGKILLVLAVYVAITALVVQRYAGVPVERPARAVIRGDVFYRDGDKFLVKGIGWDPARPGELPWKRTVSVKLVDQDFSRIRQAGFNTVRTWEAMSWEELVAAERHGLAVLQGIWLDPAGDFSAADFRRQSLKKVRDIVGYSRESRAVLGYLVLNEPEAAHVLAVGVDATREFLRLVAAEIRALDDRALVAFSSWPGVEFLGDPALDFAGANLYPFRPMRLIEAVGYEGMVRVWKDLHGRNRPLLVTEFGVSVSPQPAAPEAPGGASEQEQADGLVAMAEQLLAAGAAGGAAFSWIDGWWKGKQQQQGDEQTHDPADGEEWFGLVAMERLGDVEGRPRPALEAIRRWHEAVLTLPPNGAVGSRHLPIEIHSEVHSRLQVTAALDGNQATMVHLVRQGPWHRGWIGLAVERPGAQRVDISIFDASDRLLKRTRRVVFPPGEQPRLTLSLEGGQLQVVASDGQGQPINGALVRVALTEARGEHDVARQLTTDAQGRATLSLSLPPAPARSLVAAGLWLHPGDPPAAVEALIAGAP